MCGGKRPKKGVGAVLCTKAVPSFRMKETLSFMGEAATNFIAPPEEEKAQQSAVVVDVLLQQSGVAGSLMLAQ